MFSILVNKLTRISKTSSLIIGHVYNNHVSPFVPCVDIVDDLPVGAKIKNKHIKTTITCPFIRQFSQERVDLLLTDL